MGLTAAAYRVSVGQIPSIDFYSGSGAGVYYPAALAFLIGLNASSVLAFGQIVVAAILLPAAIVVCRSRYSLVPTVVLLLFLALLIVAPMSLGGSPFDVSFGVFYNRHGWAGLAIVLLYYVEPREVRRGVLWQDTVVLSIVLLLLVYNAINFAAVALAFVIANAVVLPYNRRLAINTLGAVAVVLVTVELLTGYNSAYLQDLASSIARKSVALGGFANVRQIIESAWKTWSSLTVCSMAFVALWAVGRRRVFDVLFLAGAVVVTTVLAVQTESGAVGVPALIAVIVCFGELARRNVGAVESVPAMNDLRGAAGSLAILGFMAVFASKPILENTFAVYHHYSETASPRHSSTTELPPGLAGFLVAPDALPDLHDVLGHEPEQHAILAELRRAMLHQLTAAAYMETIIEGATLLVGQVGSDQSIVVFDAADPFTASLNLKPTRYGYPLFWEGAALSLASHPSPEHFFSDAAFAMVPVLPQTESQLDKMLAIYGPYLEANFDEIASTSHWHLWVRTRVPGDRN